MVQPLALTVKQILQNNWALASPLQYPQIAGPPLTGVNIDISMSDDIRRRIMLTVETKEPETSVRPIADNYWQFDGVVEVKVWTRGQAFNMQNINKARVDKNSVREMVKAIIHNNAFNVVLEDDGTTPVISWMWVERESNRDEIDKAPGLDYPILTSTLKIHIMYLRQAGAEPVLALSIDSLGSTIYAGNGTANINVTISNAPNLNTVLTVSIMPSDSRIIVTFVNGKSKISGNDSTSFAISTTNALPAGTYIISITIPNGVLVNYTLVVLANPISHAFTWNDGTTQWFGTGQNVDGGVWG